MVAEMVAMDSASLITVAVGLVTAYILYAVFSALTRPKDVPPEVPCIPLVGGLMKFASGPIKLMQETYPKMGDVWTVPVAHKKFTFLLGPGVSSHFFKASDDSLSQKEVRGYTRTGRQ